MPFDNKILEQWNSPLFWGCLLCLDKNKGIKKYNLGEVGCFQYGKFGWDNPPTCQIFQPVKIFGGV